MESNPSESSRGEGERLQEEQSPIDWARPVRTTAGVPGERFQYTALGVPGRQETPLQRRLNLTAGFPPPTRTYVREGSVMSSHASSVARQLKEVELEKARRRANLDQERRRVEAEERRARMEIEADERRARKEIEADERRARMEMARGEAELRRAELEDQQKILDLEADLEKDKILEGSSQDLDGLDPDHDEEMRRDDALSTSNLGAEKLPEDPIETWMNKNEQIEQKSNPGSESRVPVPKRQDMPVTKTEPWVEAAPLPGSGAEQTVLRFAQRKLRDLPNFDGNPLEWPLFVSQFNMTTKTDRVSKEDNIYRLQKCLKGKAREAVQSMLVVAGNVDLVMKTLERRYGRADLVVESLIQKVRGLQACKDGKPEMFMDLSDAVNNMISTMDNMKCEKYLCSPELMKEIARKIPPDYQQTWYNAFGREKTPDLRDMSEWMTDQADRIAVHSSLFSSPWTKTEGKPPEQRRQFERRNDTRQPQKVFATSDAQEESMTGTEGYDKRNCTFCDKAGHAIWKCRAFKKKTVEERWTYAREKNLCFRCLEAGHRIPKCKREKSCGIDGCSGAHHSLLHSGAKPSRKHEDPANQETLAHVNLHVRKSNRVLLSVLPVTLTGPKGSVSTYALLDGGSSVTLLAEDVAEKIGAPGPEEKLKISWVNATNQEVNSRRVNLTIQGNGEEKHNLMNVRTVRNLKLPAQNASVKSLKTKWKHLDGFEIDSLVNAVPTILIGADNIDLSLPYEVHQGPKNSPVLLRTKLGYTVTGPANELASHEEACFFTWRRDEAEEIIHNLMKELWSTESFGVKIPPNKIQSKEADRCEMLLESTSRRIGDGKKWETGLLWRDDDVKFPDSRSYAAKRLHSIEKKMDRNPKYAEEYVSKIEHNIERGYARKLTKAEVEARDEHTWYLPHFDTYHPNKPKKMRVVYDAAAEVHGVSLNKKVLTGPDLLMPLPSVLMKFRMHRVAFSGDIHEFFPQIRVKKEDVDAQRFLWRGMDRNKPPDEYQFSVLTFGSACSPASALYVKDRNAAEFQHLHPRAAKAIVENHYMDDYLDSVSSVAEATQLIREVAWVHAQGGFEIRGWVSSHPEALNGIGHEGGADQMKSLNPADSTPERVLGHYWSPKADVLTFTGKFTRVKEEILKEERRPTKREILSLLMTVFDPLGLVTHFTTKLKILLQDVWRTKIGWDDELPAQFDERWHVWLEELRRISDVQVLRCYSPLLPDATDLQLHMFVDASQEAFSAVAYWRIKLGEDVHVAFIQGKSRVSPLRPMSIPRLELQAAILGTRMVPTIKKFHEILVHSTHFWSDSRTVLLWLRSDARKFKPFVAHRVSEIEETNEDAKWHWVPSKLNVADDATRSSGETDFSPTGRWFTGPAFLKLDETEWPQEKKNLEEEDSEAMGEFLGMIVEAPKGIAFHNFSTWKGLKRAVAWIKRCVAVRHEKKSGKVGPTRPNQLTANELEEAEQVILRMVQTESFPSEMDLMKAGKVPPSSSRLHCLSPKIDEDGLIRMDGRTKHSPELSDSCKFPVILDPKHRVTRLIIQDCHEKLHHTGQEAVLNELRQRYWPILGRTTVRQVCHRCPACRRATAKPVMPEMGALPLARVTSQTRPFIETGLDYFGPMYVTVGRSRVKRYGALFTCLTMRAVHVELAEHLTTDSCIMAIRRFIAMRGTPATIHCDNGTNFHGADTELKKALAELNNDKIQKDLANIGIKWRYIPPSAPHMGGSWERMVKSVKVALNAVLKDHAPREEVLRTLIAEAVHSVNSRPLTYVSLDPADGEALTPNHFLIGASSNAHPPGLFSEKDLSLRGQWKQSQALADQFWNRWRKEYLPTINQRDKWHKKVEPPKVGDFVFIGDGNAPRNSWPKAIVTELHPGKDGQVRTVTVRTSTGTMKRPVAKIMMPGSQLMDVESEIPTSGGGMSPCPKLDTAKKKEKGARTIETPKRSLRVRAKPERLGYSVLMTGVAVEKFQPTCFEREYPRQE